ncbi:MAG: hypothetical protein QOG10_6970 [Kribbellaceae bacterium]|jgi:acetyltransferase-like isoleucine patch superfamily enzyme|nr:hypothetical protein [Kribbellaceae bacterium]
MFRRGLVQVRDRLEIARDPIGFARRIGVTVGANCRLLGLQRMTFGSEPYLISIGNHVTITAGVKFVTHDGGLWVLRDKYPNIDVVGRIVIHDNVFIGLGTILLPDIEIGPNVVVGAGSVVRNSISPGTVAVGAPAKPVRTIADYEKRQLARALYVRDLPFEEKKRIFLEHTAKSVDRP